MQNNRRKCKNIQNNERYLKAFCGSRYNYFVHIPADVPTVRGARQLKHHGPSLLTLNFDGLSAVQFESQLPRTARLLRRLNGHTAYRFHKYHAVACCTIANECLLMTGERSIHLSGDLADCWVLVVGRTNSSTWSTQQGPMYSAQRIHADSATIADGSRF